MKLSLFLYMFLWLSAISCKWQAKLSEDMQANEIVNETTLNVYMDSCWNKGDIENFKAVSTENFISNLNGINVATSQNEMQAHMTVFFTGFPDLEVKLDSTYVKGNAIFTHWTSTGTHTGIYGEMAATGKKIHLNGLSQVYFNADGKIVREDVVFNELQFLQQLGYTLKPPVLE